MEYGPDDLVIIDDALKVIRKNPSLYGGEPPRGDRLAAAVVRDLIGHGDLPVSVDKIEGWWLVVCQKDWLASVGADKSKYWFRMIPTPQIKRESIRAEVLLTAFSKRLFTISGGKIQWIVQQDAPLPDMLHSRVKQLVRSDFVGRAVAFLAE
jgi:hypothetical protein